MPLSMRPTSIPPISCVHRNFTLKRRKMDALQKKRNEKKAKWMQGHDFLDYFLKKTYCSSPACIKLFSLSTKRKKMNALVCFRTGEDETNKKLLLLWLLCCLFVGTVGIHVRYEWVCDTPMRHVTHEWVMSRVNASCHTWMNRITYEWVSDTW